MSSFSSTLLFDYLFPHLLLTSQFLFMGVIRPKGVYSTHQPNEADLTQLN